uniref:LRRCT domain-containing protein n=1 Tax=Astyanax mexicanus TaxID=7994 RepID=A0A8B9KXL0_ASTMX
LCWPAVMSASSLVPCIAILLLQLWGAHAFSSTPLCPTPCLCQQTPLLNCSSSGLSEAPSHIPATATVLDLSHNAIRSLVPLGRARLRGLQHLWVGDNALESLCDCNLQTIRRWLSFDNELGNPTWKVDCFSPPHHAGKDLIHLEENVRAVEQSQFVLAVCLSVFITFIVAFILGVVLRPFLDKLWQRIRNKRDSRSSFANS